MPFSRPRKYFRIFTIPILAVCIVQLSIFPSQRIQAQSFVIKLWLGDVTNKQPIKDLLTAFTKSTGIQADVTFAAQNTTDNLSLKTDQIYNSEHVVLYIQIESFKK